MGWFYVPWSTTLAGVGLAAAIGLISGLIPAWRAAQISVVDGLRRIA
jgi:ABC-type antimicrobial peptide transport system permease subunit